jgi:hypothetical protein
VAGQVFNAGDDDSNLTLGELGELVKRLVPGTVVASRDNCVDKRSYRVEFSKIRTELGFRCLTSVEAGIEEMINAIQAGRFPEYLEMKYNNAALLKSVGKQQLACDFSYGKQFKIRRDQPNHAMAALNGAAGKQNGEVVVKSS